MNMIAARRKARRLAVQAIYQWQFNETSLDSLVRQFCEDANPKKVDVDYFKQLLSNVLQQTADIDAQLVTVLDRKIIELDKIELAVLRLAICELLYHLDVPYKVVINEALELNKIYGSVEGHKYVNGVLDKLARKIRTKEAK